MELLFSVLYVFHHLMFTNLSVGLLPLFVHEEIISKGLSVQVKIAVTEQRNQAQTHHLGPVPSTKTAWRKEGEKSRAKGTEVTGKVPGTRYRREPHMFTWNKRIKGFTDFICLPETKQN